MWVADGDVCLSWAEHVDDPFRALLPTLRHREGSCLHDVCRMEFWDVRGLDGVALPWARRCCSWLGLQTSLEKLAHSGSCRLLGAQMVCSRTARGQGSATM